MLKTKSCRNTHRAPSMAFSKIILNIYINAANFEIKIFK